MVTNNINYIKYIYDKISLVYQDNNNDEVYYDLVNKEFDYENNQRGLQLSNDILFKKMITNNKLIKE
jgi:hypothetical protein